MSIESTFNHIGLHVSDAKRSFPFYKDLLSFLGYHIICDDEGHLGMRNGPTDMWLKETSAHHKANGYHRRNTGLTHICFGVRSRADVDKFYRDFLKPRGILTLYGSPKAFPEYTPEYYAVYFEDPDRIKIEVAFVSSEQEAPNRES